MKMRVSIKKYEFKNWLNRLFPHCYRIGLQPPIHNISAWRLPSSKEWLAWVWYDFDEQHCLGSVITTTWWLLAGDFRWLLLEMTSWNDLISVTCINNCGCRNIIMFIIHQASFNQEIGGSLPVPFLFSFGIKTKHPKTTQFHKMLRSEKSWQTCLKPWWSL